MAEDGAKAAVDATPINQLERRNSLEKHLQFRPEEQDLKNRHILLDTTAAPALQARQAELERQRITDNLKKARNWATPTAAPALQERRRELERHMRADSLEKHLQARPKPEELVKEGILNANENPVAES
ncbi:hypothetical protein LTR53_010277 [Teratosphaeriaceae sp. CCFEE 6253]|nr:hypothetical protein LTR53_010277 [Teratosphaeriaceae sp. CCFEE 6253]